MLVEIYYNRTRKCWSVRHNGRVIRHVLQIQLADCTMKVSEAARQRVVQTRRRGVHAWIIGTIAEDTLSDACLEEITYSPFRGRTFRTLNGRPIAAADFVHFKQNGSCFIGLSAARTA